MTGFRFKHGEHEAEMIQPRFDTTTYKVGKEKGAFISELAFPHHLAAVGRGRGLIHSRFYTLEREQRPGSNPRDYSSKAADKQ